MVTFENVSFKDVIGNRCKDGKVGKQENYARYRWRKVLSLGAEKYLEKNF